MAIGVTSDGYREIIGAVEGLKEDQESWKNFFVWLKSRGLTGVKMIIGDKTSPYRKGLDLRVPHRLDTRYDSAQFKSPGT